MGYLNNTNNVLLLDLKMETLWDILLDLISDLLVELNFYGGNLYIFLESIVNLIDKEYEFNIGMIKITYLKS